MREVEVESDCAAFPDVSCDAAMLSRLGMRERCLDRLIALNEEHYYEPSFSIGENVEHHSNCSYIECVGESCEIVRHDCEGFYWARFADGQEWLVSNGELTKST